jgi:hypothetical protein
VDLQPSSSYLACEAGGTIWARYFWISAASLWIAIPTNKAVINMVMHCMTPGLAGPLSLPGIKPCSGRYTGLLSTIDKLSDFIERSLGAEDLPIGGVDEVEDLEEGLQTSPERLGPL